MQSYLNIGSQATFALHGRLVDDYSADTEIIDAIGFAVQLDGVDQTIDEQTLFAALSDTLLIFLDEEILSVSGATLLATGFYRVACVRARFDTVAAAHAAGADVFIVPRATLAPMQHPHFQVGNTARLKLAPFTANRAADLSEVDPMEIAISGALFKSLKPSNLRVNGNAVDPGYATGTSIRIDWSLPDARALLGKTSRLTFQTTLEFVNESNEIQGTRTVAPSSLKLTSTQLGSLLGNAASPSFTLRARTKTLGRDFFAYSDPVELFVKAL